MVGFAAVGTEVAHQPLGQYADNGRGREKRFDAHFHQSGQGTGGVVGMQGGKDHMTGQGGLNSDFRRLPIADFPNHDDVGILAQNGAQSGSKGQFDFRVDLDLADPVELVFDGIFNGDDILFSAVE